MHMKVHPEIGCCGIQCGLCPRYHTIGASRCPGCAGKDFSLKHPSCSIITCCVKNKGHETCADCGDLPCTKIASWDKADSFVTHKNTLTNLRAIAKHGISEHVKELRARMKILRQLLHRYDDGRSKSFYCLAANLLPLRSLKGVMTACNAPTRTQPAASKKEAAAAVKKLLKDRALKDSIDLSYRTGQ